MNKQDVINSILDNKHKSPQKDFGEAFAPTNIAITKYWGKRDAELNLPVTDSLSVSLADKGTTSKIQISTDAQDHFFLNNNPIDRNSEFSKRLSDYLDDFRFDQCHYKVETHSNIPIAAGLASSASGFCALVKALDQLFNWQLTLKQQSILARLGSGSACRSVTEGFVLWHRGERVDGLDSFAEALSDKWPELRIGLVMVSSAEKAISSRTAMQRSISTSRFYQLWPEQVAADLRIQRSAIAQHDFQTFGQSVENNALAMHATMHTAIPPFSYWLPETLTAMNLVWTLRSDGLPLFFTQDAGPNLKLFFLAEDTEVVEREFKGMEIVRPF